MLPVKADFGLRRAARRGLVAKPGGRQTPLAHDFMFEQTFKNIDEILWKEAGYTTELDYRNRPPGFCFSNI